MASNKIQPWENVPNMKSRDESWIAWHKVLKDDYGKKVANELFILAWAKRGGLDSDANTVALRDYLKTQKIVIDKDWKASFTDSSLGAFDSLAGFMKMGRTALIIVAVVIGIPVTMLLVNIARNPEFFTGAALKLKG